MKKFFVMMEVQVDNAKYDEVVSWGLTPNDYVKTLLTDHARDRGLVIRPSGPSCRNSRALITPVALHRCRTLWYPAQ